MKRLQDLIRPYLSIIFGALLVFFFLNGLTGQGAALALSIIALVISAGFIAYGILGIALGEKLGEKNKSLIELILIALYAAFMFAYFLIHTINDANAMGPNGWAIAIVSMVGSIGFATIYLLHHFTKDALIKRLAYLFTIIFILVLTLDLLFDAVGNPIGLGAINLIQLFIYIAFSVIIVNALLSKKEEAKVEEPKAIEEENTEE